MREKNIMLLHYITGILILVAGGIHPLNSLPPQPLRGEHEVRQLPLAVMSVYRNVLLAGSLEALLILVAFHGFNGLRVILQELHQGKTYKKAVSLAVTIVALALVVYGTRTILIAHQLANL
jgi:succinate dehydrogenase / fumarate reductase, membrane anchor subunit